MFSNCLYFFFPSLSPLDGGPSPSASAGIDKVESESVPDEQSRSPMLDEIRRDTLIASDASLVTDSIIRGKFVFF